MSETIILVHPFKDTVPDVDEFFTIKNAVGHIQTVDGLCHRINTLADKYHPGSINEKDASKFKGDALELFAEFLIKFNAGDNHICIHDYCPIDASEDYGVDGSGVGENGNPATVQVKFRTGDWILTAKDDSLCNFTSLSWKKFGVKLEDTKNMLIITTGLKVAETTMEEMLQGCVRVLNRENLKGMLDNRPEWWHRFWDSVRACRTQKEPLKVIVLREHQLAAADAVMACTTGKGKVVLPTGVGKTYVEAEVILRMILKKRAEGNLSPVIKVNSPRILLCFQLFKDIFEYLQSHGVNAKYANFNSGRNDEKWYAEEVRKMGGIYRKIVSTTSPIEVVNAHAKAKADNLPLIVFSTYHSSVRFAGAGLVPAITIHDEAHNLVSSGFAKAADPSFCPTEMGFSFTATEKYTDSDEDLGMNNPERFGETLYSRSPREMIDIGEMVPPRIHTVKAKKGPKFDLAKTDNDYEALAFSIFDAFQEHKKQIKADSWSPDEIGAKVLIVCRGQKELKEMLNPKGVVAPEDGAEPVEDEIEVIFKNKVFEVLRKQHPDLHLFALSSDFGLYNDGEFIKAPVNNAKKNAFLNTIRGLASNEDALVFHVDMVGEGIDVPGITGVMPFRNCELCKFVQNVGRSARLHRTDRARLYAGLIHPDKHDREEDKKWIKPYSWIIIPSFLENAEGFEDRFRKILKDVRDKYGYIPMDKVVIANDKGVEPEPEPPVGNEVGKNPPHSNAGIEGFNHEFEKLSVCDQVLTDMEMESQQEDYLDQLKQLGGEPVPLVAQAEDKPAAPKQAKATVSGVEQPKGPVRDPAGVVFSMKSNGITAQLRMAGDKFVLLPGAGVRAGAAPGFRPTYAQARKAMEESGAIKDGVVTREVECNSPSLAANVLIGSQVNGKTIWHDPEGREIAEYIP